MASRAKGCPTGRLVRNAAGVTVGRLLTFSIGSKQVAWPLMPVDGNTGPVAGIEPIIAAASGLRADQMIGFMKAVLVDWQDAAAASVDSPCQISLSLPASRAFELGLIDMDQRRAATVLARATTLDEMKKAQCQHSLNPRTGPRPLTPSPVAARHGPGVRWPDRPSSTPIWNAASRSRIRSQTTAVGSGRPAHPRPLGHHRAAIKCELRSLAFTQVSSASPRWFGYRHIRIHIFPAHGLWVDRTLHHANRSAVVPGMPMSVRSLNLRRVRAAP